MTNSDLTQPSTSAADSSARDRIFWSVLIVVAVVDVISKRWAERALVLHYPEEVIGYWLRWTLTYNTGAAMNLSVGSASRVVFSTIAVVMLGYLFFLYRQSHRSEKATPLALALIAAGAFGNLLDRLRHTKGVVDFIDMGTEGWRFWTFNVADMGVTVGAVLLALLMWRDERAMSSLKQDAATTVSDVASADASPSPRSEP
jgi:signal peptidase II